MIKLLTGPEYDSNLLDSAISSFNIDFDTYGVSDSIQIAFRASDKASDPLYYTQWTPYYDLQNNSGNTIYYSQLGFPDIRGRYKQARLLISVEL